MNLVDGVPCCKIINAEAEHTQVILFSVNIAVIVAVQLNSTFSFRQSCVSLKNLSETSLEYKCLDAFTATEFNTNLAR
jgi:hypothetical protein